MSETDQNTVRIHVDIWGLLVLARDGDHGSPPSSPQRMTVLFVNAESHDGDHDIPHHYTTFLTPEGSLLADSPLPPAPAAAPNRPGYDGWNLSRYDLRFVQHGQEAQPVNFDATPPLPPNKPNEEFNWESLETMPSLTKLAPGDSTTHVEHWGVFDGLTRPETDNGFKRLAKAVEAWLGNLR